MPVEFDRSNGVRFSIGEKNASTISPQEAIVNAAHKALIAASWELVKVSLNKHGEDVVPPLEEIYSLYKMDTADKCIYAAGLTAGVLMAEYPDMFTHMAIVRSEVPGTQEWGFDSYLVAKDKQGKWHRVSPAVHRIPKTGEPLFTTQQADTPQELFTSLNPNWEWPDPAFVEENMLSGLVLPEFTSPTTMKIQLISLDKPVGRPRKGVKGKLVHPVIHMNLTTGDPVTLHPGEDAIVHILDTVLDKASVFLRGSRRNNSRESTAG